MASQPVGHSLVTCPKAYSKSLKSCYSSLEAGNPTSECIKGHIAILISDYVRNRLEDHDHSPFRVLGVGSGEGDNDLAFLQILSKLHRGKGKPLVLERVIEPDIQMLETFRNKAEQSRANAVKFEWLATTFQEYAEQKEDDDVKFDVVHFFHSLYYAGLESALEHCYEKELGTQGIILCIIQREDSAFVKYGRTFSTQGVVFNPGAYLSNKHVKDIADKNGWKYVECPGETKTCDITAIFEQSSPKGNQLLDFLTHWVNVRMTASEDNLRKILGFWKDECVDNGHGKKLVKMAMGAVVILKGM